MGTENGNGASKKNVMTPRFRVSYPHIFTPQKAQEPGKKDKYGVVMLFPKGADLSALKAEAQRALIEKWGPDKAKWPTNMRNPFRDQADRKIKGTDKLQDGHEAGAIFINATSIEPPGIVDEHNVKMIEPKDFYAGCYAHATVRAFAYDNKGNCGVSFGLRNVQKLADGDPLGGRARPEDEFSPVSDPEDAAVGASPMNIF